MMKAGNLASIQIEYPARLYPTAGRAPRVRELNGRSNGTTFEYSKYGLALRAKPRCHRLPCFLSGNKGKEAQFAQEKPWKSAT